MNISEWSKEQKQLAVLAVGGTLTFLFVLSNVILGPAKEKAGKAQKVIDELESKVRRGDLILKRDRTVQQEMRGMAETIQRIREEHLPPDASRYIWALQRISALARELDLKATVQEHTQSRYVPATGNMEVDVDSIPLWIPYSVDVTLNSSFENFKNFLRLLRMRHPYASVGSIRIQSTPDSPEIHQMDLVVEWPVLRFEDDAEHLEDPREGDTT